MTKIHYFIGRFSVKYRAWYWRCHHHKYLWGLYNYERDSKGNEMLFPLTLSDNITIEICKDIFGESIEPKQ